MVLDSQEETVSEHNTQETTILPTLDTRLNYALIEIQVVVRFIHAMVVDAASHSWVGLLRRRRQDANCFLRVHIAKHESLCEHDI